MMEVRLKGTVLTFMQNTALFMQGLFEFTNVCCSFSKCEPVPFESRSCKSSALRSHGRCTPRQKKRYSQSTQKEQSFHQALFSFHYPSSIISATGYPLSGVFARQTLTFDNLLLFCTSFEKCRGRLIVSFCTNSRLRLSRLIAD